MNTRTVNVLSPVFIIAILLSIALFILVLGGCASTAPVTGPGTPDETQRQHYEMLKSAIEAQSKVDALAALALLQADVSRWQVPWPHIAKAWADLATLTDSVNKEDWDLVNKQFLDLKKYYRGY
jgi:uncharacterized protein YceK